MIRPMREGDIPEASRIVRLAFGTFLRAPDPENFVTDIDYVKTRGRADSSAAVAADNGGRIVGSNFATRWGTVGFFGPLTVHPDYWNKGIAQQLMQPILECFDRWKLTHAGLFTFSESPKHIALYQKYGFYPRYLTAILSKPVVAGPATGDWASFSKLTPADHGRIIGSCSQLTDSVYPGLNVEREIRAAYDQGLGDTVLLSEDGRLVSFAVCHCGPGTEAGNGKCYLKFGITPSESDSEVRFSKLLNAVEEFAAARGLMQIEAGVNLSRHEAYRRMLLDGFRVERTGVAMHRPLEPGYSRPGVYVIDDWR